jgi:hypothetical protein
MFYGSYRPSARARAKCMIYSDDKKKIYWDIFIALLLIIVCVIIPFRLAFIEEYNYNWEVTYYIFDLFFFFDIILTFNTTYTSETLKKEITSRKQIAF